MDNNELPTCANNKLTATSARKSSLRPANDSSSAVENHAGGTSSNISTVRFDESQPSSSRCDCSSCGDASSCSCASCSSSSSLAAAATAATTTTDNLETPRQSLLGSYRMCVVTMLMVCLFCTTSMRMNLGMAIVCMVNSTAFIKDNNTSSANISPFYNTTLKSDNSIARLSALLEASSDLPTINAKVKDMSQARCYGAAANVGADTISDYQGTLQWTYAMQSQVFSAVAYGSLLTVWFAGFLADRFGPKRLMAITLANSVIISFLSPWLAQSSYALFFAARFAMGIGEGFIYPSLASASARWFLPEERSRTSAYFTIGNQIASVVGFLVSSKLCSVPFLGGWPLIFYVFGTVGLVVLVCWCLFVTDGPQDNRWISDAERKYIVTSTSSQFLPNGAKCSAADVERNCSASTKKLTTIPIPWRALVTSKALLAIIISHIGFNISTVILQSYLPTYLKEVLRVDLNTNGILSILPFGIQLFSKIPYSIASDWLKQRKFLTSTQAVKLFQSIGAYGSASVFIGLALFVDCTRFGLAVVHLIAFGILYSAGICGFFTSMLSIAPAFSGLVTSISTTFGLLAAGFGPTLVALIHKTNDESEWSMIFGIVAVYNIFAGTVFLLFGSAEIQEWARPKSRSSSIAPSVAQTTARIRPLDAASLTDSVKKE